MLPSSRNNCAGIAELEAQISAASGVQVAKGGQGRAASGTRKALSRMKKAELVEECEERKIEAQGTMAELRELESLMVLDPVPASSPDQFSSIDDVNAMLLAQDAPPPASEPKPATARDAPAAKGPPPAHVAQDAPPAAEAKAPPPAHVAQDGTPKPPRKPHADTPES